MYTVIPINIVLSLGLKPSAFFLIVSLMVEILQLPKLSYYEHLDKIRKVF